MRYFERRRFVVRRGWMMVVLPLLLPGIISGQPTVVSDNETCRRCDLSFERIARIGLDREGFLVGYPIPIARDSRGRYYVTTQGATSEIKIFARNGDFLTTLGREGQGPGEFSDITNITVAENDSVYVVDSGNGRMTVYTPDLRLQRESRLLHRLDYSEVIPIDQDLIVANATIKTPELIGYPLHLFSRTGVLVRSFGAQNPSYRIDAPLLMRRRLAAAMQEQAIWASHITQYILEKWDIEGRLQQRIIRLADWFEPYAIVRNPSPQQAPLPFVVGVRLDSRGLLWTLIVVPAPDFADGLARREGSEGGETYYTIEDFGTVFDTVVEVIDPEGSVVVHERLSGFAHSWIADSEFAMYSSPNGIPIVDIWRVTLSH